MATPPFELAVAQRWFAIEFNNEGWKLIESVNRTSADVERMIHLAHAACLHWLSAGDSLNHQRAQCLLATAYSAALLPEAAVRHAQRCLELAQENADRQSPFDRASSFGCAARAAQLAGDVATARTYYDEVLKSVSAFDEPGDRELIGQLYPAPPR
ncbi:MAG: hypothetical protein B7Z55_09575 [Planctomycetales bacterium 12-60-4]|nr:MAG: hypothetical protein B7Z55_09575 [Planctomycetales bacterium 12-60-4]